MSPRAKQSTLIFPPGHEPRGKTERQRFDDVMGRLLSASKQDVDRRMREHKCSDPVATKPKSKRKK
jgi:hypothetical protein